MGKSKTQHKSWGGSWTEDKLDCFEKYVKAYLTIMNKYRDKNKWELFYFDGFAGNGEREKIDEIIEPDDTSNQQLQLLFEEDPSSEEESAYQGAAERVIRLGQTMRGFDFYYFIDKNEKNITQLEFRLADYDVEGKKIFRASDANTEVLKMAAYMRSHPKAKVLCLLDPYGMSVKWSTINALAGTGIDLWILVPTGVLVNRLIKNNGHLRFPKRLEEFYGLPQQTIYERFYTRETNQMAIFESEDNRVYKRNNIINEIISLYCEQLGSLFSNVTHEPLVMRNSNGFPIFHFVCASNNNSAVKIAQQIFNKKQKK